MDNQSQIWPIRDRPILSARIMKALFLSRNSKIRKGRSLRSSDSAQFAELSGAMWRHSQAGAKVSAVDAVMARGVAKVAIRVRRERPQALHS
jgi:hypothetical protein